jgi:hypothetical protein
MLRERLLGWLMLGAAAATTHFGLAACGPPAPARTTTHTVSAAALEARPSYAVPVTVLVYRIRGGLGRAVEREVARRLEAAGLSALRVEGRGDELSIVLPRAAAQKARAVLPTSVELSLHPVDDRTDYLGGLQPAAPLSRGQGKGEAPHLLGTRASEGLLTAQLASLQPPAGARVVLGYLGSLIASDERDALRTYLVGPALASGDRVSDLQVVQERGKTPPRRPGAAAGQDQGTRPVVNAVFEASTRAALAAHAASQPSGRVAVVLDGRVLSLLPASALSGQGPLPLVSGDPEDPPDVLAPLVARLKRAALPSVMQFVRSIDPPPAAGR